MNTYAINSLEHQKVWEQLNKFSENGSSHL